MRVHFDKVFSKDTKNLGSHLMGLSCYCVMLAWLLQKRLHQLFSPGRKTVCGTQDRAGPRFLIWVLSHVQTTKSSWSWEDYLLCYMDVLLPRVWIEFPPKTTSDQAYAPGRVSSRITDGSPHYSHTQIHHNMETLQVGIGTETQNMTWPNTKELFFFFFLSQILVDNSASYFFSVVF